MTRNEVRSCEDALRLLAAHLDRELDQETRDQVEHHLETCRSCFSRAEFERRLKEDLAALGREPVPPAMAARIETLIRKFPVPGGG